MIKRLSLLFLVINILLGGLIFQSVHADDPPPHATVVVSELNVRSEPAIDGNILGQFTNGTRLDVLGKEDIWGRSYQWVYVTDQVITGWVTFEYIQMDDPYAFKELPILMNRSTIPELPITGHTNAASLNLRAEPYSNAEIVTTLPNNTSLTIIGHDDIYRNGGTWLEVVVNDGSGLQGWVSCSYVALDGIRNYSRRSACFSVAQVPSTATDIRTPDSPIVPSGVTMATWQYELNRDWNTLKVRSLPNVDAETLAEIPRAGLMAVYGTNTLIRRNPEYSYWVKYFWDETPWFYVTDLATGTQGWVRYHSYLNFSWCFDLSTLPMLDAIEHPALPADIVPVDSLNGVVDVSKLAIRATHPEVMGWAPLAYLPEGTSVTLIGRDLRLEYVYVQAGEVEGWVSHWALNIDGDAHRLPIMYINED